MKCLILYVEDDAINRLIVNKTLEKKYSIDAVEHPDEAFKLADEKSYDVFLIDLNLNLPDIDGFGVLTALKKNIKNKDAVYIAHTNYFGDEWKEKCLRAGFDHYFPKPFKLSDFENILEDHSSN